MSTPVQTNTEHRDKVDRRRSVRNSWQHLFQAWIIKRIPPSRNIVLNHHNIFIFPTKQGFGFLFIILLMFIGAVNYEIRLGLALVFLLISMFVISIFYSYRNLSGLEISALPATPVFAGEKTQISVILNRHLTSMHESIQISFNDSSSTTANLIDTQEQRLSLFINSEKRGQFSPGRLTIESIFPFGICRAWSLLNLNLDCLVYPSPIVTNPEFFNHNMESNGLSTIVSGNDDFFGLREYHIGDSLQHVSWKSVARGQGMYTKQYVNNISDDICLTWDMFSGFTIEEKLSMLCHCVLKLDSDNLSYGLTIPGLNLPPGKGSSHFATVMKSLALYAEESGLRKGSLHV